MSRSLLYNLAAVVALLPATLQHLREREGRDIVYWSALGVAAAGSIAWALALLGDTWHTGLSATLWVSIAASLVVFMLISAVSAQAWRLTPLLLPYLLLLAIIATIWAQAPEQPLPATTPPTWLGIHIFVSVLTYALLTIAAVAGLSVVLQEWTLKRKRPSALTRTLPAVADAEALQLGLLVAGELVLGAGLVTGMATQYLEDGRLLVFDHKILLSLLAFALIGLLLFAHWRVGIRGRRAARYALAAYLLLTLAYPGVKFVTDVLMT
ncbi:MAG: cytochrome c biogenesis protein CcsA [Alphaproteobacteria bacterium]